ncbi:MAG TPA: tRNA uridine-5-carboxymethylaminomethyl(34) synthesis GTPase MnmE, partial [Clostridiales bacterium]|nr:tRNA uridine-5-carboxymethylaminomethyl(34) synthesis GTPase MnmE [Clostridiales bacterium]
SLHPNNPTDFSDVCAAAATPPGQSGLAVIRLSGAGSPQAVDRMFRPAGSRFSPVADMTGYTCAVGDLADPLQGQIIDQVVITRFTAPHSFTGEDVVEISCHGGSAIKQAILDGLFSLGVRPAEAGEFTRRAFLNGKLDLAQAEAIMDLIQASARKSAQTAASQLHGALSERIHDLSSAVYRLLARVELIIEYPEHEESPDALAGLQLELQKLQGSLLQLTDSFSQGRILREGLTVVIAGRPNAGKSSLLNALAGYDRAIVTPIPGTTRDTVEELIDIGGLPVRLVDTAGLRDTDDLVERLGVDRAKAAMQQADLVFWVISPPFDQAEDELDAIRQTAAQGLALHIIAGKDDLGESAAIRSYLRHHLNGLPVISFSAVSGEGLDQLRRAILDQYDRAGSQSSEEILITNSRHKACLDRAVSHLAEAVQILANGLPLDLLASLLRGCADALAGITGEEVTEELISTIFSRFCVGK